MRFTNSFFWRDAISLKSFLACVLPSPYLLNDQKSLPAPNSGDAVQAWAILLSQRHFGVHVVENLNIILLLRCSSFETFLIVSLAVDIAIHVGTLPPRVGLGSDRGTTVLACRAASNIVVQSPVLVVTLDRVAR